MLFGDRLILLGEAVLRSVGDHHDDENVGNAEGRGLPLHDEAQDQKEGEIAEAAPHDHFHDRVCRNEQFTPLDAQQL
jgi:hypothetical protein